MSFDDRESYRVLADFNETGYMDEEGNVLDTEHTKWKTLGQGVATTCVAAFDPSIAGKA